MQIVIRAWTLQTFTHISNLTHAGILVLYFTLRKWRGRERGENEPEQWGHLPENAVDGPMEELGPNILSNHTLGPYVQKGWQLLKV